MSNFNFIIIDDSALDCFIAEKMIRHTGRSEDVRSFTTASEALEFIENKHLDSELRTIIILDVLMPVMDGFEFVESFQKLSAEIRKKYLIVALTSSMNKNDIDKIVSYDDVKSLLDKPITSEAIVSLLA